MSIEGLIFQEFGLLERDCRLQELVKECAHASREAGWARFESWFRPNPAAREEVSEEALRKLLEQGSEVSDLRTDTNLSNCLVFHTHNLPGSVIDEQVMLLRRRVDGAVEDWFRSAFEAQDLSIAISGHFWYPPGGYMGWHTNSRNPGWRIYISYAEQPGESFFRYCHPETDRIVTSEDDVWNLRMFRISREVPFWHAVYSGTHRYSFGYRIARKDVSG